MVHEKAKLPCFDVCICIFDSNNEKLTCVHRVSESELSYYDPVVKLRKIKTAISDSPMTLPNMSEVRILFDFSSGFAFLLIWIPTVILS